MKKKANILKIRIVFDDGKELMLYKTTKMFLRLSRYRSCFRIFPKYYTVCVKKDREVKLRRLIENVKGVLYPGYTFKSPIRFTEKPYDERKPIFELESGKHVVHYASMSPVHLNTKLTQSKFKFDLVSAVAKEHYLTSEEHLSREKKLEYALNDAKSNDLRTLKILMSISGLTTGLMIPICISFMIEGNLADSVAGNFIWYRFNRWMWLTLESRLRQSTQTHEKQYYDTIDNGIELSIMKIDIFKMITVKHMVNKYYREAGVLEKGISHEDSCPAIK